jgi:hypothetical protein
MILQDLSATKESFWVSILQSGRSPPEILTKETLSRRTILPEMNHIVESPFDGFETVTGEQWETVDNL